LKFIDFIRRYIDDGIRKTKKRKISSISKSCTDKVFRTCTAGTIDKYFPIVVQGSVRHGATRINGLMMVDSVVIPDMDNTSLQRVGGGYWWPMALDRRWPILHSEGLG
jgi:hypothetical protein